MRLVFLLVRGGQLISSASVWIAKGTITHRAQSGSARLRSPRPCLGEVQRY